MSHDDYIQVRVRSRCNFAILFDLSAIRSCPDLRRLARWLDCNPHLAMQATAFIGLPIADLCVLLIVDFVSCLFKVPLKSSSTNENADRGDCGQWHEMPDDDVTDGYIATEELNADLGKCQGAECCK